MKIEKLLLASTNTGKTKEIRKFLSDLPIKIFNLNELKISEIYIETGSTFLENARGKAIFYNKFFDGLTLAEDSGLEVEKLKGAPGIFSARFAGEDADDEKNNRKLLSLLKGVSKEERRARFVCAMVLIFKREIIKEIVKYVEGYILEKPVGSYGFGYDPIFYYPPLNKSFAQLLPEEKNKVSHRGKALKELKKFLKEYLLLEG
jgi:XTP/dITP diphosphohydrolase